MHLIYCHGLPGSSQEVANLGNVPDHAVTIVGPDDTARIAALMHTGDIDSAHVIGFSLGAMTAIEIAAEHPHLTKKLTLIAPAAPLELGDFLPDMAGHTVFRAAQLGPFVFKLFTLLQKLAVSIAPQKLINAMFRGSPPADLKLLEGPNFQAALLHSLQFSFGENSEAYRKRVCRYVKPWAGELQRIQCPVTLHHGEVDNWAPASMSHALVKAIRAPVDLIIHPNLGHYSTLHSALPTLLDNKQR